MSDQRTVLVTGAGRGIGFAIASRFGADGDHVVVNDKDEVAADAVAERLREAGISASSAPGDISNEETCGELISGLSEAFGRLDALVNNAATGRPGRVREQTERSWTRVLSVNLIAPFLLSKAALDLLASSKGAIVNIASAASYGMRGQCSYDASKGGLISLTRSLALELGEEGIRVNAVCPGYVDTEMLSDAGELRAIAEKAVRSQPLQRLARPSEIAEAVVWLASPEASYVTGHSLFVDGGWIRP